MSQYFLLGIILALNIHEIHAAFVKMQGTPGNSSCQETILRCMESSGTDFAASFHGRGKIRVRPKKVQQAMQGVEKLKQDQAEMVLLGVLVSDKDLNARGIGFYFGNMRWTSMQFMDVHGQNIQNPAPGMIKPL